MIAASAVERRPVQIAPSILSADFARLADVARDMEQGGAPVLHLDVMDGRFVPNITFGPPVVKALRRVTTLALDCHLMIVEPGRYVDAFIEAGADWVTIHAEAAPGDEGARLLRAIRTRGKRAAVAIRPDTDASVIEPWLRDLDMVLVMTVYPGFSGQGFMPEVLPKVRDVARMADRAGLLGGLDIQVDGGIADRTIGDAAAAGANVYVVGNGIFTAPDPKGAVGRLRELAEKSRS